MVITTNLNLIESYQVKAMLKNISRSIFIGLITSLSAISLPPAADAEIVFCNKTNSPIKVVYARGTIDLQQSIQITNYDIQGWISIDPAACKTASTEPAIDRSGLMIKHYYYAKSTDKNIVLTGEISPDTDKFCIKDTNFKYSGALGDSIPKHKCDSPKARLHQRGYREVSFSTFSPNAPDYTVSITSQKSSSPQSKIKDKL